jgi:predicted transcriptional regulator
MKMAKKIKKSISEMILEIKDNFNSPKTAEDIRVEIKDSLGHTIGNDQIKMTLLRMLRKKQIKRKKEGKIYKYHF